uniref:Uncharacterized protein n=1 Tax=Parastrongyloides trichosuri TaxID=131310 RepID=A0A0N4ZAA0_PARTI
MDVDTPNIISLNTDIHTTSQYVPLREDNFDLNYSALRDIGAERNDEVLQSMAYHDKINEILEIDFSDNEELLDMVADGIEATNETRKNMKGIINKNIKSSTKESYKLASNIQHLILFDHCLLKDIEQLSEEIRKKHINARNLKIRETIDQLNVYKRDQYKMVWTCTKQLCDTIGYNLLTDKVTRFNELDHGYGESDEEYMERFIGGYKYHLYNGLTFRIFHSPNQYPMAQSSFEDLLKDFVKMKRDKITQT